MNLDSGGGLWYGSMQDRVSSFGAFSGLKTAHICPLCPVYNPVLNNTNLHRINK